MIHLRANLEQAARFSVRQENKHAAETAIRMMDAGTLRTRGQVDDYIKRALAKAKKDRT